VAVRCPAVKAMSSVEPMVESTDEPKVESTDEPKVESSDEVVL
jgi:hypothetical protein